MLRAFDSDWLIAKSRADWIVVFILIIFCAWSTANEAVIVVDDCVCNDNW
jgi:hypothetical protein